jgi:hypothetical protein
MTEQDSNIAVDAKHVKYLKKLNRFCDEIEDLLKAACVVEIVPGLEAGPRAVFKEIRSKIKRVENKGYACLNGDMDDFGVSGVFIRLNALATLVCKSKPAQIDWIAVQDIFTCLTDQLRDAAAKQLHELTAQRNEVVEIETGDEELKGTHFIQKAFDSHGEAHSALRSINKDASETFLHSRMKSVYNEIAEHMKATNNFLQQAWDAGLSNKNTNLFDDVTNRCASLRDFSALLKALPEGDYNLCGFDWIFFDYLDSIKAGICKLGRVEVAA